MKSVEFGFSGAFHSLRCGTGLRAHEYSTGNHTRQRQCCALRLPVPLIGVSVGIWEREHVVALAGLQRVLLAEGGGRREVEAGARRLRESGRWRSGGFGFCGEEVAGDVGYADAVGAAQGTGGGPNTRDLWFEHLLFRGRRGRGRRNQAHDVLVTRRRGAAHVGDAEVRTAPGRFARNDRVGCC